MTRAGGTSDEPHAPLVCRLDTAPDGGGERWVEASLTDLTADPAVSGLMLRLRDVTERRRLERAHDHRPAVLVRTEHRERIAVPRADQRRNRRVEWCGGTGRGPHEGILAQGRKV